jgi:amidase
MGSRLPEDSFNMLPASTCRCGFISISVAAIMRNMSTLSRIVLFTILALCAMTLDLRYGPPMLPMLPAGSSSAIHWRQIVAEKLRVDDAKIPRQWRLETHVIEKARTTKQIAGSFIEHLLDPETRSITSLDVQDLVAAMANGSLSAVKVVTAFCKRASYAHQLVRLSPSCG